MIDQELSNIFSDIANSIRAKGLSGTFTPYQFSSKISEIHTGGDSLPSPYINDNGNLAPANNTLLNFKGIKKINDGVLRERFSNIGSSSEKSGLSVQFPDLTCVCINGLRGAFSKNLYLANADFGNNEINIAYNASYNSMDNTFANCTNLSSIQIKIGPHTTSSMKGMLSGCTSLVDASGVKINLTNRYLDEQAMYETFAGCKNLKYGPDISTGIKAINSYGMYRAFTDCSSLISCSPMNFSTAFDRSFYQTFRNCVSLSTAPGLSVRDGTPYASYQMFQNCYTLKEAKGRYYYNSMGSNCCYYMFSNCSALTSITDLESGNVPGYAYAYMFQNCSALSTAPRISATTVDNYGMRYMFQGCTSLTGDVYICLSSATNTNAMQYMFQKITNNLTLHFRPQFASKLSTMLTYPKFGATGTVNIVYDI